MKFQFKNLKFTLINDQGVQKDKETKLISPLNSQELRAVIRKLSWRIVSNVFGKRNHLVAKLQLTYRFGTYIHVLARRNGEAFAVKYLKACALALQRAIAGSPVKSLREIEPDLPLPRLSRSGLPIIMGLADRRAVLSGGPAVIRFWLSMFNLYRILSMPFKPKLDTITDAYTGREESMKEGIDWMHLCAIRMFRYFKRPTLRPGGLLKIWKASSTTKISWHGVLIDLLLLHDAKEEFDGLRTIDWLWELVHSIKDNRHVKPSSSIWEAGMHDLDYIMEYTSRLLGLISPNRPGDHTLGSDYTGGLWDRKRKFSPLGKLSPKEEAAGKLRIFALVDAWTQSALKPIHDYLFEILRQLPNDGTFDQDAAVRRGAVKAQESGQAFSFDLSAATDRLPMELQHAVLAVFLGKRVADAWRGVLLSRSYLMQGIQAKQYGLAEGDLSVRYAVGQPMGAYSSWAMLAVTHHLILQACNIKVGKFRGWATNYEVLGDDIIIFDKSVADAYLAFMAEIGVAINMSKSVISPKGLTLEFAKKTIHKSIDVSGLSWRMFKSLSDFSKGRLSIAMYLFYRGYGTIHKLLNLNLPSGKRVKTLGTDHVRLAMTKVLTGLLARHDMTVEQAVKLMVNPENPRALENSRDHRDVLIPLSKVNKLITCARSGDPIEPLDEMADLMADFSWRNIEAFIKIRVLGKVRDALLAIDPKFMESKAKEHIEAMSFGLSNTRFDIRGNPVRKNHNKLSQLKWLNAMGEGFTDAQVTKPRALGGSYSIWGVERVVATAWFNPAVIMLRRDLFKAGIVDPMNPLLHSNPMRGVRNLWLTWTDLHDRLFKLDLETLIRLEEAVQTFKASLSVEKPEVDLTSETYFKDVLHDIVANLRPKWGGRVDARAINDWGFWKY